MVLLAVTFAMVESAYGSVTFTNNVDFVANIAYSNTTDTVSTFMDSFETDTKEYLLWVDDTCDDLIFFSTTTDGITFSTPITINYIGGGCGVADQVVLNSGELAVSGTDVYVAWIEDTNSLTQQDMFLKHSSDGGATFGVERTVVLDGNFTSTDIDMVANSLEDVIIFYRNQTTGNLENFVSHDDGATWAVKTVTGSGTVDEQSLKMIGNDIFVGGSGITFQKSTDAGDTWLGSAIDLSGVGSGGVPFLTVNGTDINLIYYDATQVDYEQARSVNGGTSFVTSDLDLPLQVTPCRAGTLPIEDFIVIADGDSVTFACLLSADIDIKLIHSQDGSVTWDAIQTLDTESTQQGGSFVGYAKDEVTVLVWRQQILSSGERIAYSVDSLSASPSDSTWSLFPELFPNDEIASSGGDPVSGSLPVSYPAMTRIGDRLIIVYDDSGATDEQFTYSFEEPYCITDEDFNCPLDLTNKTTTVSSGSTVGSTATSNGFFTMYRHPVILNDIRVFFTSTTDAVTSTTPIDLSGAVLTPSSGSVDREFYIFENSGTIDTFWIEGAVPTSELFHARSTNGGTSFGAKTSVVINATKMEPVVNGNNIDIAFIQKGTPNDVPKFIQSTNGGTSYGSVIDIEGTGDCDDARQKIKLTKSASGNFYSAWMGKNATSVTNAICFNSSTDGGSTWGTTELILDDSTAQQEDDMEFFVFSNYGNVTVIWENSNDDEILQARSTDFGASFSAKETALSTVGAPCTDPATTGSAVQTGSNIIIVCSGSSTGIHAKKSSDMGATYSSFIELSGTTNGYNNISGFASGSFIFFVASDSEVNQENQNRFVFSTDSGSTFNASKTMFMKNEQFRILSSGSVVGTSSGDVFVSAFQKTNYDATNNYYVSTASLGVPPPTNNPPVISISGDNPLEHLINTTYTDAGAVCNDPEDGSITTVDVSTVNTALVGTYTVTYTCTDSGSLFDQEIRTVNVVEQISTTVTTGGGAGAPVSGTVDTGIEGFTPEQQLAFDQAVSEAIASIEPSEGNIVETIIQTFFEFIVVDKVHEDLQLQSFLDDQRLGFRWSTGDDLVIVSATPALSPFMFTFEQFPAVKQGSGAFVSTNFILYNLEVPRTECTDTISVNCVEKIRYEIPVTVNAIINGTQVSDTGSITVDLTEDEIDPILLIVLATLSIPIIGVIIQRSRGRSSVEPLRRVLS